MDHSDGRQCRICFESGSDGEQGPLFRPCICRGSMAWVHMECLDTWRKSSVNPRSFYRCEACLFEYKFAKAFSAYDRFTLARVLNKRGAVHALSLLVLAALVLAGGFVAKLCDPTITWWEVIHCFNVQHLLYGSTVTGLGSLLGWVISLVGGGGGRLAADFAGYGRFGGGVGGGGGGDKAGKIILVVLVVIGLCVALKWIYDRIERHAQRTVRQAQFVVLDVQASWREAGAMTAVPHVD